MIEEGWFNARSGFFSQLSPESQTTARPRWQKRHRVNQRVGGGVRFFDSIVCNKINCFYSSISIRRLLSDERSEALPIDWWANFHARLRIICNQIHAAEDEWNYVKGKRPRTYKSRFAVSSPAVIFLCNVAVAQFWCGLMMHARFGAVEPDSDEIRYCHDTRLSHKLSTSRINFIIFCHQLGEKRMNNYPGRVNIFSFTIVYVWRSMLDRYLINSMASSIKSLTWRWSQALCETTTSSNSINHRITQLCEPPRG